jgi:hypothetical protein
MHFQTSGCCSYFASCILLIMIVSLQKPIEQMTPDSELHMRGGGVVGDWSV